MRNCEIRVAQTEAEIQAALALRRQVFVEEQQIFTKSDIDQHDTKSVYLNAWAKWKLHPLLIGTVRCYPDDDDPRLWWGGRLAVHPDYRGKGIGVYLINAAVREVKNRGAVRFLAYIQSQNVNLFKKMRWSEVGETIVRHGHPHQLMEADLNVFHASNHQAARRQVIRN